MVTVLDAERTKPAGASLPLEPESFCRALLYYVKLPLIFLGGDVSNAHGILNVLDLIRFRPLGPGILPAGHPWITGADPADGRPIWPRNVVYATPRRSAWAGGGEHDPPSDEEIVCAVGRYMAAMAAATVSSDRFPQGRSTWQPAGINYIHGPVQHNTGFLIFNDFADATWHISDPAFRAEVRRFVRETRREVTLVFRERYYHPRQYAHMIGTIRAHFCWFSNPNGPPRHEGNTPKVAGLPPTDFEIYGRILWGVASVYPVINMINGSWIRDMWKLRAAAGSPARLAALVRPPVEAGEYFRASYRGTRVAARWPETAIARLIYWRIRLRKRKGNLYFTDRRERERQKAAAPRAPVLDESDAVGRMLQKALRGDGGPLPAEAGRLRVLLVPGFGWGWTGRSTFAPTRARLEKEGVRARLVEVGQLSSAEDNAEVVRRAIEEDPAPALIFGHSKGAIDAFEALARYPQLKDRVFAVAAVQSPYFGSPWADWVLAHPRAVRAAARLLALLGARRAPPAFSASAPGLADISRAARSAAGNPPGGVRVFSVATRTRRLRSLYDRIKVRWLRALRAGRTDGTIEVEDARVPGSRFALIENADHLDLVLDCCRTPNAPGLPGAFAETLVRWVLSEPSAALA